MAWTSSNVSYEDGVLVFDGDLTGHDHKLTDEPMRKCCPICGCESVSKVDEDTEDFDTIINGFTCDRCGTEFSVTYWAHFVSVRQDGRFS